MNKTKLLAISGLCAAVVAGCLLLVALVPFMRYLMLFFGVIAAIATVIPLMFDSKNLVYSLMIYFAGSILGVFAGVSNLMWIVPIVAFCIPFAIVMVYGERVKIKATVSKENVFDDPFDDEVKVVKLQVKPKTNLSKTIRWILYYVLLEMALGLTALCAFLFTRSTFELLVANAWFWVILCVVQLVVLPYDRLLRGCLNVTAKIISHVIKQ